MSYSYTDNTNVRVYWFNRPLTARAAFDQMIGYLRRLQQVSPVFSQLYLLRSRNSATVPLAPDFSNFDHEVALGMNPDWVYQNPDPTNIAFTLACHNSIGFTADFATVPNEQQAGCWITLSCGRVNAGKATFPDFVILNVSPELETPEFLRTLLEHTVQFWHPDWGTISHSFVYDLLQQPIGDVSIGWLTYFDRPAVAGVLPPSVSSYPLAEGLVVQAAERPGTAEDPAYVSQLLLLRNTLKARSFLRDPRDLLPVRHRVHPPRNVGIQ